MATDIDLSGLNSDQLADLATKAHSEMASREKQRRKDLRSELERRVAAEDYKMGDIIRELRSGGANGTRRLKIPAKLRNPQIPMRPSAIPSSILQGIVANNLI